MIIQHSFIAVNSVFIHSALQLSLSCNKPVALSAISKYEVIIYEICSVDVCKIQNSILVGYCRLKVSELWNIITSKAWKFFWLLMLPFKYFEIEYWRSVYLILVPHLLSSSVRGIYIFLIFIFISTNFFLLTCYRYVWLHFIYLFVSHHFPIKISCCSFGFQYYLW